MEWLSIFMTAQSPPAILVIQGNRMQYTRNPADPVISASSSTQSLDSLPSAALTRILSLVPLTQVFVAQRISRSFSAAARSALKDWKCLALTRVEKKHRLVMHKTESAGPRAFSQSDCLAWDLKHLDHLKIFTHLQVLVLERWVYNGGEFNDLQAIVYELLTQSRLTLRQLFVSGLIVDAPEAGRTFPQLNTLSVGWMDDTLVRACPSLRMLECRSTAMSLRHLNPELMTHLKCGPREQEYERLAAFVNLESLHLEVNWVNEEDDSEVRNSLRHAIRCMRRLRHVYIFSANMKQFDSVISDLVSTADDLQCLWLSARDTLLTEDCLRSLGSCMSLVSLYLDDRREDDAAVLAEAAVWTFLQEITGNGRLMHLIASQVRVLDAAGNRRSIERQELKIVIDQVCTESGRDIKFAGNINDFSWCSSIFAFFTNERT